MQKKLMLLHEDEDELLYRITCSCTDQDHDVEMLFERNVADGPYGFSLTLMGQIKAFNFRLWSPNRFEELWHNVMWRIKTALKILFVGNVKGSLNMYLDDDNIGAFEVALQTAKEKYKGTLK